ncbi:MAG: copper chaperone PCu(A)C [Proteobacteria bacterium]|nr:copper chaperone PCu(A)C [Pseudomonadota bacterium]
MNHRWLRVVLLLPGMLAATAHATAPAAAPTPAAASSSALQAPASALQVQDAWVRAVPGTGTAALYLRVRNDGPTPITLVAVSTGAARSAMIHQSQMVAGRSTMRMLDKLVVAPGQTVSFAPGGLHIMLEDLTRPLRTGDMVHAVLQLSGGAQVPLEARVRPLTDG